MGLEQCLSCSVGSSNFRLIDYKMSRQGIYRNGVGRIAFDVRFDCDAEVVSPDSATLVSDMAALDAAMEGGGEDFKILVSGNVMHQLLSSECYDDGPFYDGFTVEKSSVVSRKIKFFVTGKIYLIDDEAVEKLFNTHDQSVQGRPDNLRVVSWTGTVSGAAAADNFEAAVLTPFRTQYDASDGWIVSYEFKQDSSGTQGSYTLTAVQMVMAYPSIAPGNGLVIVDGEGRYGQARDEQARLTETWEFDLLLKAAGNVQDVIDTLRTQAINANKQAGGDGVILRESASYTLYKETHLQASFTLLRGGDGDRRMDFSQSFELQGDQDAFDVKQYPGVANPQLVKKPGALRILSQSGYTVGQGFYLMPPDPLYPDRLIERPRIKFSMVDLVQMRTEWTYLMALPPSGSDEFDFMSGAPNGRPPDIDYVGPQPTPPGGNP